MRIRLLTSLLLASIALVTFGCSMSRTLELERPRQGEMHGAVQIEKLETSTVDVNPNIEAACANALVKHLAAKPALTISKDAPLRLQYRFVQFDPGSTIKRVGSTAANLAGSPVYGIGDGALAIEVFYVLPDGTSVGHIISDGPITGPLATSTSAASSAAESIARYTKDHYAEMMPHK